MKSILTQVENNKLNRSVLDRNVFNFKDQFDIDYIKRATKKNCIMITADTEILKWLDNNINKSVWGFFTGHYFSHINEYIEDLQHRPARFRIMDNLLDFEQSFLILLKDEETLNLIKLLFNKSVILSY